MEVADSDATEAVVELPLDLKENKKASVVSLVPPIRFGHVNPGVSRGAYPTLRNFRFLSRLQLKTIVSLTPEPPIADLVLFAEMAGIKIVHFPIGRMAGLSESVQSTIMSAVNICIEAKNHPVYVHCLDGRRVTSLVVVLLRRVQGWTPLATLSEYWRYQVAFKAPIPTLEVEKTTKELETFAAQCADVVLPESMPKWLWGGDRATVVPGVQIRMPPAPKDSALLAATGTVSASAAGTISTSTAAVAVAGNGGASAPATAPAGTVESVLSVPTSPGTLTTAATSDS